MKRFSIAAIMVLFLITCLSASIFLEDINSLNDFKELSNKNEEWIEPDIENINHLGIDKFNINLPIIHINTYNQSVKKDEKIWGSISVLEYDQLNEKNIMDKPDYEIPININLRGASSYSVFDKEQYRIKFYREKFKYNEYEYGFLGMNQHYDWVLNGPFLDKTLLRNKLTYDLARDIFSWAPDSRFCEVFLNGKYKGVYLAVEPVSVGVYRLNLKTFGLLSGKTAYIVKRDREGTEVNPMKNYGKIAGKTSNDLYIEYPKLSTITKKQIHWIEEDISKFERALYSDDFKNMGIGYKSYIDINNFVDYYIFNEIVMNNDAGNLSTYVYKDIDEKLRLSVWDFNNAYDNYQWFEQDYNKFFVGEMAWFNRMLNDREFVDLVIERYFELRKDILSIENFNNRIDGYMLELGDSIDRNFKVWGYTFSQDLLIGDRNDKNYNEAISRLKLTINKRISLLDDNIFKLYDRCIN